MVHSVIRSFAPQVTVIDLVHEVPAHDIRAGALALWRAMPYLDADGVVLAVVDPGVATTRRAIAIQAPPPARSAEAPGAQRGQGPILVGPDNGLLLPALSRCPGPARAVELSNRALGLGAPGPTFAGRDVFAPAAAHLCNGVALDEFGPPVDLATLVGLPIPEPTVEPARIGAEVLWVDRYGNLQLNVRPDQLDRLGPDVVVGVGDRPRRAAAIVVAYADLAAGQLGLLIDSSGLVALALNRSSAAAELEVAAGQPILLAAKAPVGG